VPWDGSAGQEIEDVFAKTGPGIQGPPENPFVQKGFPLAVRQEEGQSTLISIHQANTTLSNTEINFYSESRTSALSPDFANSSLAFGR